MFFQRLERRPNVYFAMRDLLPGVSVKSMALLFLGSLAEHPVFGSQSGFCGHAEEKGWALCLQQKLSREAVCKEEGVCVYGLSFLGWRCGEGP